MSKLIIEKSENKSFNNSGALTSDYGNTAFEADKSFIVSFLIRHNLKNLRNLFSGNYTQNNKNKLQIFNIDELEMLEAELINQGILTPDVDSVSKKARHKINLLVWEARRLKVPSDSIDFRISLDSFIYESVKNIFAPADDLINNANFNLSRKSFAELNYFEQFTGYLNGEFETPKSRYEKGLNLVLKVIKNKHESIEVDTSDDKVKCILPIMKKDFVSLIKKNYPEE